MYSVELKEAGVTNKTTEVISLEEGKKSIIQILKYMSQGVLKTALKVQYGGEYSVRMIQGQIWGSPYAITNPGIREILKWIK